MEAVAAWKPAKRRSDVENTHAGCNGSGSGGGAEPIAIGQESGNSGEEEKERSYGAAGGRRNEWRNDA